MVGALEEERAFFLVEKRERVVDVQLRAVGLDLGKIRIQGRVQGEVRCRAPFDIHARVELDALAGERRAGYRTLLTVTHRQRRRDLEVLAGLDAGEPAEFRETAQVAAVVAIADVVRQAVAVVARAETQRVDAPLLHVLAVLEAQRRERDFELDDVAGGVDLAGRVPQAVPRRILVAALLLDDQVHLRAPRVREDFVRAALVVEGVEHQADEIVAPRAVAIAQVRADGRRLRVLGDERDQQVGAVLGQVHRGLDRRRRVFARAGLVGQVELGRLLPKRFVELAVEGRTAGDVGDRGQFGGLGQRGGQ